MKTSIESNALNMKAFINVCQSDAVSKATCEESSKTVDEKRLADHDNTAVPTFPHVYVDDQF